MVSRGVLLETIPWGSEEHRTEQREKLGCTEVVTQDSAHPTESSGAGMALVPTEPRQRGWAFIPLHRPVTECGLPLGRDIFPETV